MVCPPIRVSNIVNMMMMTMVFELWWTIIELIQNLRLTVTASLTEWHIVCPVSRFCCFNVLCFSLTLTFIFTLPFLGFLAFIGEAFFTFWMTEHLLNLFRVTFLVEHFQNSILKIIIMLLSFLKSKPIISCNRCCK